MNKTGQKRLSNPGRSILLYFLLFSGLLEMNLFSEINRPFPQVGNTPCFGIKPNHRSQTNMNMEVVNFYTHWIADYMMESTVVPGDYKINYNGNGATVSEAMGYGMLITVLMSGGDTQAQLYFDGLNRFRKRYPSSIDPMLMEWKIFPDEITRNDDCATDGDIDMAMALLMAHIQWGEINYFQEATNLIHQIETSLIREDYSVRLGDWNSEEGQTRSSDFITTHFRSFYLATENGVWTNVENKCYAILEQLQDDYASATGLIPDFSVKNGTLWEPASPGFLEGSQDGHYYYNACRDPWRIGLSSLYYHDDKAQDIMTHLMQWVTNTSAEPSEFKAGYKLDGSDIDDNNYDTAAFISPLGIAAMVVTNQSWLNDTFDYGIAQREGYYEDSINLLTLIAMSGNMWLCDTPDADRDNIPDAWERNYVHNLTDMAGGGSDWDGDGYADDLEYIARTDPTDSNNVFQILSTHSINGTHEIYWMTASDNVDVSPFYVDYSTNLLAQSGGWLSATGQIEIAEAGIILFQDHMPTSNWHSIFYRIGATNTVE